MTSATSWRSCRPSGWAVSPCAWRASTTKGEADFDGVASVRAWLADFAERLEDSTHPLPNAPLN